MKNTIANYVKAGYSGLYIVSHEEQRIEAELKSVAESISYSLFAWSLTDGLVNALDGEPIVDTQDPLSMLDAVIKTPERSMVILRDFHLMIEDKNPIVYRKLKDALLICKNSLRVLIVLGCRLCLPPELEKEITVLEYKLPDREQLRVILDSIADSAKVKLNGNTDAILDAASGLTTIEAENAFALSVVESKDIVPNIVSREKSTTVKKNGLLEIIEPKVSLDDIGGLELLKQDLFEKRNLFSKQARDYGLPTPRGILVCGQPGTGKSLTATATGAIFKIPLVKLEAGKVFGSLVGESERNWRTAFATAKAIAPCVLWIDEVDGLFAGSESSGKTDGGTTARVIKAILQDMQFNGDGIFFVFTANDIDNLPDPLIDRLDVWSVDLPNGSERESIWGIQIAKEREGQIKKRSSKNIDLPELAGLTDGFSGRQIEQVWLKALTLAFNKNREPKADDVREAASRFVPTSITCADAIERRRKRLANRAMPASKPEEKVASTGRKIAK